MASKSQPSLSLQEDTAPEDADSISLRDFMVAIRKRSRIVWGIVAGCVALGIILTIMASPQYNVTLVVSPAQSSSTSDSKLSSALSSFAAPLAGLVGSGGTGDVQPFDLFMQLIISPRLSQRLIEVDPTVLQNVFYKEWDPDSKSWHLPHDPISILQYTFNFAFGLPAYTKPSPARLATYLTNNLQIAPVGSTAMQSITLEHRDPQFTQRLLRELLVQGDAIIRDEALARTDKQIAYLEKKLDQTQQLDYRQTLLALLSSQETTRMSINKGLPYAASVLQWPYSTDLPAWPNPILIIAIAAVIGLLISMFATLLVAVIWPEGVAQKPPHRYRVVTFYHQTLHYFLTPVEIPQRQSR